MDFASDGSGSPVVARIGRPHGIRGEVTVALHTDSPADRFLPGARFGLEPGLPGGLTLASARLHNGTWLLAFDGVLDRTAAQDLRGRWLLLASSDANAPQDGDSGHPNAWYEHELVGLRVEDPTGRELGTVSALHIRPVQDLLEIQLHDGRTVPVPFVTALVPTVDIRGGRVVLDPPGGLLDLAE